MCGCRNQAEGGNATQGLGSEAADGICHAVDKAEEAHTLAQDDAEVKQDNVGSEVTGAPEHEACATNAKPDGSMHDADATVGSEDGEVE